MYGSLLARLFVYLVFGILIYAILKILIDYSKNLSNLKNGDLASLKKLETRQEPFNLVLMIILLLIIFIFVNLKVGFEFDGTEGDLPGKIMAIIPGLLLIFILCVNLVKKLKGEKKVRRFGLENEQVSSKRTLEMKIDLKRKFYHIFVFCMIFTFLFVGYLLIKAKADLYGRFSLYFRLLESYWGSSNDLDYVEIIFLRHSLPLAQTLTFLFMYGAALILLVIDLTRLSRNIHFIMHKESQRIMRYKELDTLASYTHFAVSYLFASIILPPMLFLASLCLASFADPAASIIGYKFGKKRYYWNSKSIEGTIFGSLFAFLSMIWFVGWFYAFIGMVIFAIIDIFTPKPIKISDNLLMPVITTIIFVILSFAGIPYTPIFTF